MFKHQQQPQAPSVPPTPLLTIIGATARIEGKFEIADSIEIECEVGGELRVGGKLIIGEKGIVNANVETVDAIILGHYEGNMTATGNVEIAPTGRVRGTIKTDSFVVSKGGSFKGNVAKISEESAGDARPLYVIDDKLAGQSGPNNDQMLQHACPPEG